MQRFLSALALVAHMVPIVSSYQMEVTAGGLVMLPITKRGPRGKNAITGDFKQILASLSSVPS